MSTKLIFISRFMGVLTLFILPSLVLAQSPGHGGGAAFTNPISANSIEEVIAAILRFIVRIGAIIVVFFFIYSGFLFVTSQGNDAKIQKAKTCFMWTVIGTAVLIGAETLANVIKNTVNEITS